MSDKSSDGGKTAARPVDSDVRTPDADETPSALQLFCKKCSEPLERDGTCKWCELRENIRCTFGTKPIGEAF